jgi:uncharacterized protein involved in exopolysaccharide biosynthesis
MQTIHTEGEQTDISLARLLRLFALNKWLIILITIACGACAAAAAWFVPPSYKVNVVLLPVSENTGGQLGGGLGGLAAQFGGLASLAGISLQSDTKKSESVAVLQSEALTERYINENHLLPILFANKWDSAHQKWTTSDLKKVPTLWKANEFFRKNVRTVATDSKTGLVTLTITWNDAALAAAWANGLVHYTNDYLRSRALEESERNIAYLTQTAAGTDLAGVKQAIYSILQTEISREMLARGTTEYAFKVLDAAVAPERPNSPVKPLWVFLGLLGGLALSSLVIIVRPGKSLSDPPPPR